MTAPRDDKASAATPRPWRLGELVATEIRSDSCRTKSHRGCLVVEAQNLSHPFGTAEANVELIVKAVNSYDEREALLSEAAEAFRAVVKDHEYQNLYGAPHFTSAPTEQEWKRESAANAMRLVRAVLSKLESK